MIDMNPLDTVVGWILGLVTILIIRILDWIVVYRRRWYQVKGVLLDALDCIIEDKSQMNELVFSADFSNSAMWMEVIMTESIFWETYRVIKTYQGEKASEIADRPGSKAKKVKELQKLRNRLYMHKFRIRRN